MYLVLCYDIVEDRRRTKLFTKLHGFLEPVQKSVFEGAIPTQRLQKLLDLVSRTIDHETDTVRIYHLCNGCRPLTELIGTAHQVSPHPEDIVV